uniref:Serine--tRNA ligase n=1 Tax=Anthurium amnicola TaxID=1678845 RepID=A0A1D1YK22_9ARAE
MITIGRMKGRQGGRRAAVAARPEDHLEISLPDFHVLRLVARSLLALALISLPVLGITPRPPPVTAAAAAVPGTGGFPSRSIDDAFFLPMIFRDLRRHGLFRPGGRVMLLGRAAGSSLSRLLRRNKMELVAGGCEGSGGCRGLIPDGTLDFVFFDAGFSRDGAELVDRALKVGGVAAVRLRSSSSQSQPPDGPYHRLASNYKIVYVRRFDSTVVAMRKVEKTRGMVIGGRRRRLLAVPDTRNRKEALNNLEDVFLEPPRFSGTGRMSPRRYLKRTRYLPDLMGDTLDHYPRRVFVEVVTGSQRKAIAGAAGWIARNYPTGNRALDVIRVEVEADSTAVGGGPGGGEDEMSRWLRRNVREEEYVVMKAEAGVVEEMVRSGAVGLVDELFLQCRHGAGGARKTEAASGLRQRAYWECLSLYGKLRDAGVAVHQWWWD